MPLKIDDLKDITLDDYERVVYMGNKIELSNEPDYKRRIEKGHKVLSSNISANTPIYGVNTGFGDSCRNFITCKDAQELQRNLVKYHGCGIGPYYSPKESLGILLLRLISNAKGYSGVTYKLLKQMELYINHGILPAIPEIGTVGASGDLTPLSYLAAALCGQRKVYYLGELHETKEVLEKINLKPIELQPKEGLAIMNGTSVMTAIAANSIIEARKIALAMEYNTALTVEVLMGNKGSFAPVIHEIKPHPGQIQAARNIAQLLKSSGMALEHSDVLKIVKDDTEREEHRLLKRHIQDRYSLRCAPQVLGVLRDTIDWTTKWIEIEMNSVSDNPIVDYVNGQIHNGGNFYGGHICSAMDALRAVLGNAVDLADKQVELMIDEKFNNGLTPNLVNPALSKRFLHHGMKALQITCTSVVAEITNFALPTAILSRPTEAYNQDKVSLGTISARLTRDVVRLCKYVCAIQLLVICQAMDLRGINNFHGVARKVYELVREKSPFVSEDRELDQDIEAVKALLDGYEFTNIVQEYLDQRNVMEGHAVGS